MQIIHTTSELRQAVVTLRRQGKSVGFVPTMGAIHAGHLSLAAASQAQCDATVVSIFVNPTQFGPGEDFDCYPRTLGADCEKLQDLADIVFAPSVEEMYPDGSEVATYVDSTAFCAKFLEGERRPGHFRGVMTVVLKLFAAVQPDVAFFGQKDYQQCCVVRQMIKDLLLPVELRVCPIVREEDGLAMSSRNEYLSTSHRQQATVLFQAIQAATQQSSSSVAEILVAAHEQIGNAPDARIDYVTMADGETLEPFPADASFSPPPGSVLLLAVFFDKTRLIDNGVL